MKLLITIGFFFFNAVAIAQDSSGTTVNASETPVTNPVQSSAGDIKAAILKEKFFARPLVDGRVGISLSSEDTYSGRTANNPINSFMTAYILGNIYLSEKAYIATNIRYSGSSGDSTTGNYFIDEGVAFFAELTARYDSKNWSAFAGATRLNYSLARDYAASIWGNSFVRKEVGVDGMMALGGSYKFDTGKFGNHALSGSLFMVDTTFLSDTYGSSRDATPLSKGGPANTGNFNNYALALDGIKIAYLPRFRYQIATVQMRTDSLRTKSGVAINPQYLATEQRYAVAGMWDKIPLAGKLIVTPLVEYNSILNSEGINGFNKEYYIGSLLFGYKQWNLGMSGSVWNANWNNASGTIKDFIPSNNFINDRYNQFQTSLGYSFKNGIKLAFGYRKENKMKNMNTQTVGINLKYDLPFSF